MYRIFILSILIMLNCGRTNEEDILAVVGNKKILVDDFISRLEFTPRPIFRSLNKFESNSKYLDFLIGEKLFSIEAEKEGLSKTNDFKNIIKVVEDRAIIKEFYRKEIKDKISVSNEEILEAFRKKNRELSLKFFKAGNREQADKFKFMIDTGILFETALETIYKIPVDSINCRQQLRWGDFNHRIEEEAYKLEPGGISPIIDTHLGYFIIKLDSIKTTGKYSEGISNNAISGITKLIRTRKETELSMLYVKEYMEKMQITLKGKIFSKLAGELMKNIEFTHKPAKNSLELKVFEDYQIENVKLTLRDILDEKLVTFKNGSWTIEDILERLKLYSYPLERESEQKFISSLNRSVKYIVRDDLLVKKAKRIGIENSAFVRKEVNIWSDYFLCERYKAAQLKNGINLKQIINNLRNNTEIKIDKELLQGINITDINLMAVNPGWIVNLLVPPFPKF